MPECSGNIFQEALETEKTEGTSTPTIMIDNPLPIFFLPTSITHKLSFHLVNYCCAERLEISNNGWGIYMLGSYCTAT